MDQFPLKARLDIDGTADTYTSAHAKISATANQFFGPGQWKLLDVHVEALSAYSQAGDEVAVHFRYSATVAGPTS